MNNTWEIKSNVVLQKTFIIVGLLVGLLLVVLGLKAGGFADNDSAAALLLGLLMALVAIVTLVINSQRTVTVDPDKKQILITDTSRFKQQQQIITFTQITEVYVTEVADREDGNISYDMELKLSNGDTISLFNTPLFDATYNKARMESYCQHFRQTLNL